MWYQRVGSKEEGYTYVKTDTQGPVTDKRELKRLQKIRIPPGYHDVLISGKKNAKVLAFGFDAKNRKQMIYNPDYIKQQADKKYEKFMANFNRVPTILTKVERVLSKGMNNSKEMGIAVIIALMFYCGFRIGNKKYLRENQSYGLTTLEKRHIKMNGDYVTIKFVGKKGVTNISDCHHAHIMSYLKNKIRKLKASERVFTYVGVDGKQHSISSKDVNEYIQSIVPDITSKDIRTWNANKLFMEFVKLPLVATSKNPAKRSLEMVAHHLHHTPTVCKSSYIHPEIYNRFETTKSKYASVL